MDLALGALFHALPYYGLDGDCYIKVNLCLLHGVVF